VQWFLVATKRLCFANFFKGQNGISIKISLIKTFQEAAYGAKEGFQLVDSDFLS
jgi:leucyl-tRNA synthetase